MVEQGGPRVSPIPQTVNKNHQLLEGFRLEKAAFLGHSAFIKQHQRVVWAKGATLFGQFTLFDKCWVGQVGLNCVFDNTFGTPWGRLGTFGRRRWQEMVQVKTNSISKIGKNLCTSGHPKWLWRKCSVPQQRQKKAIYLFTWPNLWATESAYAPQTHRKKVQLGDS